MFDLDEGAAAKSKRLADAKKDRVIANAELYKLEKAMDKLPRRGETNAISNGLGALHVVRAASARSGVAASRVARRGGSRKRKTRKARR